MSSGTEYGVLVEGKEVSETVVNVCGAPSVWTNNILMLYASHVAINCAKLRPSGRFAMLWRSRLSGLDIVITGSLSYVAGQHPGPRCFRPTMRR